MVGSAFISHLKKTHWIIWKMKCHTAENWAFSLPVDETGYKCLVYTGQHIDQCLNTNVKIQENTKIHLEKGNHAQHKPFAPLMFR